MSAESTAKVRQDKIDLETTSLSDRNKLILSLMWPALAENILASLVSMADTIMVSGIGEHAVRAVGLCMQPRMIMFSCFMALGTGATALVARAKGAGNREEANTVLRQALMLTTILLVILCTAMAFFCRPLISWIAGGNIGADTVDAAVEYFNIQIAGFPFLALSAIMTAVLRGSGNTRASFYSNTAANLVNVVFNYLLIGGNFGFPKLGVTGASIATVLGQIVACSFCFYLLVSNTQFVHLSFKESFKPDLTMIKRITNIGIPALGEQLIMRVGLLAFTTIVTSLGDEAYTAHTIGINIQSLSFTTGMAFGIASTTLTGQCLGRKRPDLAEAYIKLTQRWSYAMSFVVAIVLFFFGGWIAQWYTDEAPIIAMVASVLQIVAIVNPFSNARFVYNSALRGAGDAKFTAVCTFVGLIVVRLPVAILLVNVLQLGITGVWIAFSADPLVIYIMAKLRWHSGRWAKIKV